MAKTIWTPTHICLPQTAAKKKKINKYNNKQNTVV